MTVKQRILKSLYPAVMWMSRVTGKNATSMNAEEQPGKRPSIYNLAVELNNGSELRLQSLQGKKLLLVNTASNCGFTGQYDELQKLADRYSDQLVVIAFPANDFGQQEPGDDAEIAKFCRVNYGVTFPLAKKGSVVKTPDQQEIFAWLSHKEQNGWNDQEPTWNFSKYLLDEDGVLIKYFDPGVSPLSRDMLGAIITRL